MNNVVKIALASAAIGIVAYCFLSKKKTVPSNTISTEDDNFAKFVGGSPVDDLRKTNFNDELKIKGNRSINLFR